MNPMSNIQTIVDIGFIALVTITCCRALMLSQNPKSEKDVQRRTEQWQSELQQVEGVLRRLVADATSAGQSLDRQLSRRHEELAALVRRIDQQKTEHIPKLDPEHMAVATENAVSANTAQNPFDDLPNPTWHRNSGNGITTPQPLKATRQEELSASNTKPELTPLSSMIEVENREEQTVPSRHEELIAQLPNALGVSMLTNSDIAAYKVAARLLTNGKEIHVVARKLSLPIHEVRALERLLRGAPAERLGNFAEPETTNAPRTFSRNEYNSSEGSWTLGDEDEDPERDNPLFFRDVSLL